MNINAEPKPAGTCTVPMWAGGLPAGSCGAPAYGCFIPGETWRDAYTGQRQRYDGKYNGYSAGLCCPNHAGPGPLEPRCFQEGLTSEGRPMYCAVHWDFTDLQTSPAEFHPHPWVAVKRLLAKHPVPPSIGR